MGSVDTKPLPTGTPVPRQNKPRPALPYGERGVMGRLLSNPQSFDCGWRFVGKLNRTFARLVKLLPFILIDRCLTGEMADRSGH